MNKTIGYEQILDSTVFLELFLFHVPAQFVAVYIISFIRKTCILMKVIQPFHNIVSVNRPVAEFKEFEPRFKSAKTRFNLSAGLNLETFDTILSGTNHIKTAAQIL